MTTRHYYVDPATQVPDPKQWILGREVTAREPLPNGRSGFRVKHLPEFDLYEAIEDPALPGQYERWPAPANEGDPIPPRYALTFEGTVGDQAARVREEAQIERLSVAEVYDRRVRELLEIYQQVINQGVTVTIESNGVQDVHTSVEFYVQYDSIGDTSLPDVTQFTTPDLWGRFFVLLPTDVRQGSNLKTLVGLHYTTTNAVSENHESSMRALRDADDYDGLVAYDLRADWPEAPTPPSGEASLSEALQLTRTVQVDTLARALANPRVQGTPGGFGTKVAYVYQFLLRNYDIRDDMTSLFDAWLVEHPGA